MEWKDTCDAFGSQLDYEALVRCSKKKQALSKAYVEACTLPNGCLFDYRLDSMGDFQALFSLYPLEHLARATALQYFDAVLSKTFETRSDLPFHCLRLASKFIGGRDLNEVNDSEYKENLKDTTLGLSANETFLVTTLDWRLCSPTVYTLFHNLRQQNDLKYRNKVDDEVADKSIIDSLYDRYLLRFVPHHHASALVFHLCLVPQEKEEAVYFLCDKDDVNDCLMVINRKHSSDEEDVEDNENPSGGLTNGADATEEEQSDKQETESAEETNYDDTPDSSIEGYGFDASEEAAEEKDVDYGSDASEEEAEKQDVDIKNQFYDLKDSNIEDYGFDAYEEEQDVDYGSDASEEEAEEQDVDIKNQFYDLEGSDVDKMNEILKELHISCQRADGTEDEKKVTQLLELYEIEIQMYTEPKNNKKLKLLYQKALALNSAISQPRIVGIIHECGGKIHMAERQWVKAAANFFKAFKNYDEAGNQRRIPCLKYLILAYMLMQSEVNPIDGQEAKAYKNDPEILVMTDLIAAYQRNEILEFEKILKNNERTIKDEPFIRNHIEDLLKNVRTQALLNLIKPYTRIRIPFISKELNVPEADVEELLVSLILDNRVQGRIDQVNRLLECGDRSKGMKKYTAVDKWNTLVRSLYQ